MLLSFFSRLQCSPGWLLHQSILPVSALKSLGLHVPVQDGFLKLLKNFLKLYENEQVCVQEAVESRRGHRMSYSGSEPPDVGAGNSLGSLKEQEMLLIAASSLHSLFFFTSFSMFSVCIFFSFLNDFVHYITLRLFPLEEQDRHAGAVRMAQ